MIDRCRGDLEVWKTTLRLSSDMVPSPATPNRRTTTRTALSRPIRASSEDHRADLRSPSPSPGGCGGGGGSGGKCRPPLPQYGGGSGPGIGPADLEHPENRAAEAHHEGAARRRTLQTKEHPAGPCHSRMDLGGDAPALSGSHPKEIHGGTSPASVVAHRQWRLALVDDVVAASARPDEASA